ncbi:hypothetical protein G4D82_12345 [Flavobacterium sp. CYK-4]|uniref:hypothetical protein n=1 Tax=Flavobacterium lotistagni TaxID=2709660 RepID=UPI00140D57CA|nr:hypothetical protein [Flavobacterium lotistagni]NHM08016.1 hypothetical protein [Flavobacterium lotistagni]
MLIVSYFKSLPLVVRQRLIIALLIVAALAIGYIGYTYWADSHNEVKIVKKTIEKTDAAVDVENKKAAIKQAADEHIKSVDDRIKKIRSIRDNTKNNKPIHYEKPIINTADYDAMRDSLDSAMPD